LNERERSVLVIANETVAGASLIDALRRRAQAGPVRVTVICPVSNPREGYVVYEDTRRAAAGRRLEKTLQLLHEAGIPAYGFVVEADPEMAVRDAIHQLEPRPEEIVVSTHPAEKSGWMRRDVIERIRHVAGGIPVEHVVVDLAAESGGTANVLVIANQTVVGEPLLQKIRERAARGPASFLIVSPQGDTETSYDEAERRLRRAVGTLRGVGLEVHGQVAHPDPFTAALEAVHDERVDELIVSTFPGERSGWLRRDLIERLRKETALPVEHVVVEPAAAEVSA
jgi:hypothetical protein